MMDTRMDCAPQRLQPEHAPELDTLPKPARRLLKLLMRLADRNEGYAVPRQTWLAKALELHPRNVRRWIAYLVEKGWIDVCEEEDDKRRNRYFVRSSPEAVQTLEIED